MDPITAIGLASAIITFIELGSKIVKRLEELSEAGDVPKVFRDIRTRLPLVMQIVERTRDGTQDLSPGARASFEAVIQNCYEQVAQLTEIMDKITIGQNDSRWKKGAKALASLVEENRVSRIATALKDNVQLLTFLNVSPTEKQRPILESLTASAAPPSYASTETQFFVPFNRDEQFVGREKEISEIATAFEQHHKVAIAGIGGVGKSEVAVEFAYRYKERNPSSHIFWVWGGNAARFDQGYKRIAKAMDLPGWDDPEISVRQLMADWLSKATTPYLLVLDNADNIQHWWPNKYNSSVQEPATENLSSYLPDADMNGYMLVTTRDSRIASRLTRPCKPISVHPMSKDDARQLFTNKAEGDPGEHDPREVDALVHELDNLPLAISQAAAFIDENSITVADYIAALEGDDAEEFLQEELDDSRRDQDSINSIFRTFKLSFDQLQSQKPTAADLLSLMSVLDRQSVPKLLLTANKDFKRELTTSLGTLQAFSLLILRANKETFQLHRLVQRFVKSSLRRSGTLQQWQAAALKCLASVYPTEIGAAEYDICESLNPHVLAVIAHDYTSDAAELDLAHLLCWSADFSIEKNLFQLAAERAKRSLDIFVRLVPETDERRAAATWLYGRLLYYEAQSDEDMNNAARILENALRISTYPSLNYAETAFELAHLYYDQSIEASSLNMGKASYECWKAIEGPSSKRTLDNLHDYALELGLYGHEAEAIAKWNEILSLCPTSTDTSENTRKVFELRSLASISEFSDDAAMAEMFYKNLISLCGTIYNEHHLHVFDYRLSHCEQILRQDRLDEAAELSRDILVSCQHSSEWQIRASCLQIMAECYRLQHDFVGEEVQRIACMQLHEQVLGRSREETIDALEGCARCYMRNNKAETAEKLLDVVVAWRNLKLGPRHQDTIRAVECQGICAAAQGRDVDAEVAFLDALGRQTDADPRLLGNLCTTLWNQAKWDVLEARSRQALALNVSAESGNDITEPSRKTNAYWDLLTALERQGKVEEAVALRAQNLQLKETDLEVRDMRRVCEEPPSVLLRRFGRIIHPRTWSA